MKKILIISPHFPPSNLVGVHRARFLAMHLPEFGWKPTILTVDEKYYEQTLDRDLEELLSKDLRIEKVNAFRITRPRLIGDIGLRALINLYKKAKQIINDEQIDFLYITIPSFYTALLGRWLNNRTKVPYGIDYQDPWVHKFPGSERILSRHWLATKVSKLLEPIAVKNASLISGVAESYYKDVIKRNKHLAVKCLFANIPIGTEPNDHRVVKETKIKPYHFKKGNGKIKLVYAGTMLPKAYAPFEEICKGLQKYASYYSNVEIYFIGSGNKVNDPESFNIKPLAEKYGLWEHTIFEFPKRIPYLDTLAHLNEADGIFLLGSTESHYSPSKVFQGIVSGKPIFAVLHIESMAVDVINQTKSGIVLTYKGEADVSTIFNSFKTKFDEFLNFANGYIPGRPYPEQLQKYFARNITGKLATFLDKIVPEPTDSKKILIISPHFPPSNLTAVHRARLFSQYLPKYGWTPIVLTVDEQFYEENLDYNLQKLVSSSTRIEKVKARKIYKPRIIGDIGLRSFYSLYKKARQLIKSEKIDFLYIIIPSFYGSLWGRMLYSATGIKYGIDYIDPWVHLFPGGKKLFSKAWIATKLSRILEPVAIRHASLITGVAESYYKDVFIRNERVSKTCTGLTLPPAAEQKDFEKIDELKIRPTLFKSREDKIQLVYAGAMLPKAYKILEEVFKSLKQNNNVFEAVEFHFIGTGYSATDPQSYNIKPLAEKYGLWEEKVYEYPARIPYLDVLVHLNAANGIFILGSTEAHYTPSKVYQAILSRKPVLAVLHKESTGVDVVLHSRTGIVLDFDGADDFQKVGAQFVEKWKEYLQFMKTYSYTAMDQSIFEKFSADEITGKLAGAINKIINN